MLWRELLAKGLPGTFGLFDSSWLLCYPAAVGSPRP